MKAQEIWTYIHAERGDLADTLDGLTPAQWDAASWCEGWTVQETAGHVVAAAEQTFPNFYKELVRRLRARTTTTNHPPAPVMAMLGEIVVHGDDIRRPLGLSHRSAEPALKAVADSWKNSNLLIGAKRRISGLRLRATDTSWSHGDGPEVVGPLQSLVLAMTGRKGSHQDLSGDGLPVLASRA